MRKLLLLLLGTLIFNADAVAKVEAETAPGGADLSAESTKSLSVQGMFFSDAYLPYNHLSSENIRQFNESLWLKGEAKLSNHTSAFAEVTIDQFQKKPNSAVSSENTDLGLREGFARYFDSGYELKVGRVIMPWGKSDGINPTDVLSIKNNTFFNPTDDLKRVGTNLVSLQVTPNSGNSPLTIQGVVVPITSSNALLIPDSVLPSNVTVNSTRKTDPRITNSETALRISYEKPQWDTSLVAYRGYDHTPEFTLASIGGTFLSPTLNITPMLHRKRLVGADLSAAFGDYVFRLEGAHVWTENNDGKNPITIPRRFEGVVGVERPLFTDYRVHIQYYARYFPQYVSPDQAGNLIPSANAVEAAALSQIAQSNALIQNYQDRYRSAITFRFGYNEPTRIWDAEIFTMVNMPGGDYLLRPKASYSFNDALRGILGLERYSGNTSRPLGTMRNYNSIFTEIKYTF